MAILDDEFDDFERVRKSEKRRFKRWLKKNKPVNNGYYWMQIKGYLSSDKPSITIGQFVFSSETDDNSFAIIGDSTSVPWHQTKILRRIKQ